jgi:hypothetical protein
MSRVLRDIQSVASRASRRSWLLLSGPFAQMPICVALIGVAHDERRRRQAVHVECTRGWTEIDDPTAHKRSAIIDSHHDRAAIAAVDDSYTRAKWQSAVRGSHLSGIHDLAARCLPVAVNRGDAETIAFAGNCFCKLFLPATIGVRSQTSDVPKQTALHRVNDAGLDPPLSRP